jgi:hypothetical protein
MLGRSTVQFDHLLRAIRAAAETAALLEHREVDPFHLLPPRSEGKAPFRAGALCLRGWPASYSRAPIPG